jgi:polyhydroxyalkanoate synthesis regulator phasin
LENEKIEADKRLESLEQQLEKLQDIESDKIRSNERIDALENQVKELQDMVQAMLKK